MCNNAYVNYKNKIIQKLQLVHLYQGSCKNIKSRNHDEDRNCIFLTGQGKIFTYLGPPNVKRKLHHRELEQTLTLEGSMKECLCAAKELVVHFSLLVQHTGV